MRLLPLVAAPALALALLLSAAPAAAAPPAPEVKALLADAARAMKAKRWADALTALRQAHKLDPSPAIELQLGEALTAGGRLVEARRVLRRLAGSTDAAPAAKKARDAANKRLAALAPRIPTVEVTVAGPDAGKGSVQIDGIDADAAGAIPVDPGEHTVSAAADGFEPAEKVVQVEEGAHERVELTLASKAPPPPPAESKGDGAAAGGHGSRVLGAGVTVLGAAGLVMASVFGGIALKAGSDTRSQCSGDVCPASASDDLARTRTFGDASTAAFVAGGVITAAGVVLIVVAPRDGSPASARVSPWVGPGRVGVGVTATF